MTSRRDFHTNANRIIECLQRAPGLTSQQIAGRLDISQNSTNATVLDLFRKGILERIPSDSIWCYYLSKKDR